MRHIPLMLLLLTINISCKKEDLSLDGQSVKARVLYRTCAGTILQWVDTTTGKGQQWQWATIPDVPASNTNPTKIYLNCVSAFDIPTDRQVVGDTLVLTYKELTGPLGNVCTLGGLPTAYISVKALKSK